MFQPLLILGLALQNSAFVYRRVNFCPFPPSRENSDFCSECEYVWNAALCLSCPFA